MSNVQKQIIELYPDYCSSGLWKEGVSVDPESLGVCEAHRIALLYWHHIWEFFIGGDLEAESKASPEYIAEWEADGEKLASLMTAASDEYEFVYRSSEFFNSRSFRWLWRL